MVGNTGTYLDSPFHRYADGADLAGLAAERAADLPAVVVRSTGSAGAAVDVGALAESTSRATPCCCTPAATGTGARRPTRGPPVPDRGRRGAGWSTRAPALVGIDAVNIDDTADRRPRPAHSVLLAAGIPIVEHLTGLADLPPPAPGSPPPRRGWPGSARSRSGRTRWRRPTSRMTTAGPADGCRQIRRERVGRFCQFRPKKAPLVSMMAV